MRKTLTLHFALMIAALSSFAQTIANPQFQQSDDMACTITKIERNGLFTIVSFESTAANDSAWIQLNKEIFIQANTSNEHYNYVKSENIAIVPNKQYIKKRGDKLLFRVFFEKIPEKATSVDIIERAGIMTGGITYFNFYNVSLSNSRPDNARITDVVLTPPSPYQSTGDNMFNNMAPMFGNMARSMMDAQLDYYKQPGKIAEVAKLTKQYYLALVKEGFSGEQAFKLITANTFLPKSSMNSQ